MHYASFKDFQFSDYASTCDTARGHSQAPCSWNCRMLTTIGLRGASLLAQMVKNLPQCSRVGFSPLVGKIPQRREWLPTPVFLPGKLHGQRGLAGCTPCGRKESDTTEQLTLHFGLRLPVTPSWVIARPLAERHFPFCSHQYSVREKASSTHSLCLSQIRPLELEDSETPQQSQCQGHGTGPALKRQSKPPDLLLFRYLRSNCRWSAHVSLWEPLLDRFPGCLW